MDLAQPRMLKYDPLLGKCHGSRKDMLLADSVILILAVALEIGLMIGAERERRKGEGPSRSPAGIRTFRDYVACWRHQLNRWWRDVACHRDHWGHLPDSGCLLAWARRRSWPYDRNRFDRHRPAGWTFDAEARAGSQRHGDCCSFCSPADLGSTASFGRCSRKTNSTMP